MAHGLMDRPRADEEGDKPAFGLRAIDANPDTGKPHMIAYDAKTDREADALARAIRIVGEAHGWRLFHDNPPDQVTGRHYWAIEDDRVTTVELEQLLPDIQEVVEHGMREMF